MAHVYREVRQRSVVRDSDAASRNADYVANTAARIVSLLGGIVMSLLTLRFILSLLGANRLNPFADFVYSVSHPFVAPFFGLFNYQEQFGIVRFEFETLIAIAFWGFLTWVIVRIITIGSDSSDV